MSAHRLLVVVAAALLAAVGCGGGGHRPQPTPTQSPSARPPVARVAWTHAAVLRRIGGRKIVAGGRTIRIDPATVTCDGLGPAQSRHGQPAWVSFRCVQPTFPRGSVAGPDAIFEVVPTGAETYTVAGGRLTHY
jgi:hypothetical protein